VRGSLSSIVGQFKSLVTKRMRRMGFHGLVWQRNYYERVIRNEQELFDKVMYIQNNPKINVPLARSDATFASECTRGTSS
jgi:hypothetical protein